MLGINVPFVRRLCAKFAAFHLCDPCPQPLPSTVSSGTLAKWSLDMDRANAARLSARTAPESMSGVEASDLRPLVFAGGLLSAVLVIAILYFAKQVLVPLVLAIMLAFLLTPAVSLLERLHFHRPLAVISAVAVAGVCIGLVVWLVSLQLNSLIGDLPKYEVNVRNKIASMREASRSSALARIQSMLEDMSQERPNGAPAAEGAQEPPPAAAKASPGGWFAEFLAPYAALLPAFAALGKVLLSLILAIFMLMRREDLRNRLVSFMSRGSLTTTTRALDDAGRRISRYMTMQLAINGSFGLLVGIGLFAIGVRYALLWGLFAGILRYIPYVGAWLGSIAPLAVTFVTSTTWTSMLLVLALFAALEIVTGNVIEPMLYGQGTGVSEVALLISAVFWAWLWGPVGLMLSTPLTVCVVVAGKYVPSLAFLDKLLGDSPGLKPFAVYLQRLLARDVKEASGVVREFCRHHSPDAVYDELFIPALALARRDRATGGMLAEDEVYVVNETSALVKNIRSLLPETAETASLKLSSAGSPTRVSALPAHDGVEELTLLMLQQLVAPAGIELEIFSTRTLPAEMVAEVERASPALAFIAALAPGGIPQAVYLCEKLRKNNPQLGIVVGYWGCNTGLDEVIAELQSAGANYFSTTLLGGQRHILSMLGRELNPQRSAKPRPLAV